METYGELKSVMSWSLGDRKDLGDLIPEWIQLAERQLYRQLRVPAIEKIATWQADEGSTMDDIQLPGDYLEAKSVAVNGDPAQRVTDSELLRQRCMPLTGFPTIWARLGSAFGFYPSADSNYPIQMIYWADYSGTLVNDSDTTQLLRIAPDAHLAGAMYEAHFSLRNIEEAARWKEKFAVTIGELNHQARLAEYSGSTILIGNPK